jgi:poly-gamma-glutamate synthesis protein (capsule biosynthesis protein)
MSDNEKRGDHNMQWKAFFAGDVCIEKPVPNGFIDPQLARLIARHEVRGCNFEGTLRPPGAPAIDKIGPALPLPDESVEACKKAGFNVFNLANNHLYDFGEPGLHATMAAFQGCLTVGAGMEWDDAYALKTMQVGELKVGFLSFAEAQFGALTERGRRGGYAWVGHRDVESILTNARKQVDVLFVQCHAGVEEIPVPLPEWRQTYRKLVDWGADAVIGHHPHVPQGWEYYKGKPIAYSLGNFYFPRHPTGWGIALSMTFDGTTLVKMQVLPIAEDRMAMLAPEREGELVPLCSYLSDGVYEKKVTDETLRLWRELYADHYRQACDGIAFPTLAKDLARFLFRPQNHKRVHLLHNLRIESHRWTVERALTLMTDGY